MRARGWRWEVVAVVVPLAALLLGATLLVPARETVPDAPDLPGASETRCLDIGPITDVAALDRFARTVRGDPGFAGGDVGASVELQDGRFLFVFGDTLRGDSFDGEQFVHNSMLVFSPGCGQVVLPADHGAIVPDRADGVGYWPMSVARVPREGYDLVGVGVQRVRPTGSGVFSFEVLGPAVATFIVPVGKAPQLLGVHDLGADHADPTRPMWGAAAAVHHGWVYCYGTSRPADATTGGFALQVARFRPEDLARPGAWRYWDGGRWQDDPDRAAVLVPAAGGVSETLSVFHQGRRWYALSKRDEVLGSDLTVWTAPGPTGPFTAAPALAQIPSDAATGTLRYLPLAHPALLPVPGTVVVGYSENNTDVTVVRDDPRRYRPRFLRVVLPR